MVHTDVQYTCDIKVSWGLFERKVLKRLLRGVRWKKGVE